MHLKRLFNAPLSCCIVGMALAGGSGTALANSDAATSDDALVGAPRLVLTLPPSLPRALQLPPLLENAPFGAALGETQVDASPSPFERVSYAPLVVGGLLTVVGAATGLGMHVLRNSSQRESSEIRNRLGRAGCASVEAASTSADCDRLVTLAAEYDAYGKLELVGFLVSGASLLATGAYYLSVHSEHAQRNSTQLRANVTARASSVDILVPF